MKRHLTEKNLIEYQFKLASEGEAAEIAAHLEACRKCTGRLEQLKQKFSALELLRGEQKVSEQLVQKALAQTRQVPTSKIYRFPKPVWLSAAAVIVLILGVLIVLNKNEPEPYSRNIISPTEQESVKKIMRSVSADTARIKEYKIAEKPPFAPASAIELVVLPRRNNVQITVYNSADLTLVREKRNLTLKRGWNWLQFMWSNTLIDPTSLTLEPRQQADKIEVQQLVYPARLKDIGRWLIHSEIDGLVPFEITYFTSGVSWRAFYMGTLVKDEKTMCLKGYVRVTNNSGEDYENAQTRLIVGKVHLLDQIADLARRQNAYGRPGKYQRGSGLDTSSINGRVPLLADIPLVAELHVYDDKLNRKEIKKEGLSEYFLYTIEGTETILNAWSKRLQSFDVNEVPVVNLYKYEEERYRNDVVRFLSFKNDTEHKLGETPIPGGMLKVYRTADNEDHLSYTGQSSFKYIPVDEDVELNLGPVSDVLVKPVLMDYKTENYLWHKRDIVGWDEIRTFEIEVRNRRDIPVKIEIQRNFATQYWKLQNSGDFGKFEKVDLDTIKYTLQLKPNTTQKFSYVVRTYRGTRKRAWREN